jgi:hypothetical protein
VVGAHVHVAFTEMDQMVCVYLGLCADYLSYGTVHCRSAGGVLKCPLPRAVPLDDFDVLIRRAEGS